jgi:hypothetical protein
MAGYPQFHCSFTKFTPDFSLIAEVAVGLQAQGMS